MRPPASSRSRGAFTLVELMTSLVIISLLMLLLVGIVNQTSSVWQRTSGKVEQFREVRAGFDAMTTQLAQATLNTYWDYDNRVNPQKYQRRSELRFISGPVEEVLGSSGPDRLTHCVFFQAPLGQTIERTSDDSEKYGGFENLLCTWGYCVEYGDDKDRRPPFLPESKFPLRHRFRLMELAQPAEENQIYRYTSGGPSTAPASNKYNKREWVTNVANVSGVSQRRDRVLAENVIALIITPRLAQADEIEVKGSAANPDLSPLAPNYLYDSAPPTGAGDARYRDGRTNPLHQLPPILQVTMVAIDELSAGRLDLDASTTDPFDVRSRFQRSADYSQDLLLSGAPDSLENTLIEKKMNYRIFTTNVVIRNAKWSRETTN